MSIAAAWEKYRNRNGKPAAKPSRRVNAVSAKGAGLLDQLGELEADIHALREKLESYFNVKS